MRQKPLTTLRRTGYFGISLAFFAFTMQPAFVFADGSTDPSTSGTTTSTTNPSTQTPSAPDTSSSNQSSNSGPQKPNGAAANTYQYNANTGLWENDYYTWDPVSHQTGLKTPLTYTCDPTTNQWDYTQMFWSASA